MKEGGICIGSGIDLRYLALEEKIFWLGEDMDLSRPLPAFIQSIDLRCTDRALKSNEQTNTKVCEKPTKKLAILYA